MKTLNGKLTKSQSGFTLIEIAIVLVIIGLLLGGVLQGQQLIENSRVKSAISQFNGISAAAYSYQDRYGRLPGDDGLLATLQARGGSWGVVTKGGDLNGALSIPRNNTFGAAVADDSVAFFQHLRASGFLTGDPAADGVTALPQNAFGGLLGLTTQAVHDDGSGTNSLDGLKMCMSSVSGKSANALDTQMDDGAPDTGRFRANESAGLAAPTTAADALYSEDNTYAVCYILQ